jgi:hypothetical protein
MWSIPRAGLARFAAASTLGLAVIAVPLAVDATAAPAAVTASSVLAAAKSAIAKEPGVHLALKSATKAGSVNERVAADLGAKDGTETITEGIEQVTVEVTPKYVYFRGNAEGLEDIIGVPSSEVKTIGKDWVSVKAGTTQYSDIDDDVNISSVPSLLPDVKGTKLSTRSTSKTGLYLLKWDTKATSSVPALTSTLTVSAVGRTLPVTETREATSGSNNGSTETVALSKWGEKVTVKAPARRSTIPYSKVTGSTGG